MTQALSIRIEDHVPDSHAPDIVGSLLLKKCANLLDLGAAAACIEEQIAQFAAVGHDIDGSLCRLGITLEHQDLMFGSALVLDGVHGASRTRWWSPPLGGRKKLTKVREGGFRRATRGVVRRSRRSADSCGFQRIKRKELGYHGEV